MINLQQDADGFIRMDRHFPASSRISITFTEGAPEEFSGQQLNEIYDAALAVYREQNHLDTKGFSRAPATTAHLRDNLQFVPVHPGMAKN